MASVYTILTCHAPGIQEERLGKTLRAEMKDVRGVGLDIMVSARADTGSLSTRHVSFTTSKATRWQTDPRHCHLNWVICDSDWEDAV